MYASAFLRSLLHLVFIFEVFAEYESNVDAMNKLSALPCVNVTDAGGMSTFLSQKRRPSVLEALAVCFTSPIDKCVEFPGVLVSQPSLTATTSPEFQLEPAPAACCVAPAPGWADLYPPNE
jgi:hypothetical protein